MLQHAAVCATGNIATTVLQVPQEVREARRDELVSLQEHVGQQFAESLVGSEVRHFAQTLLTYGILDQCMSTSFPIVVYIAITCSSPAVFMTNLANPLWLQIMVLVDSIASDGEFLGRTQWDAPDVDPMVFLTQPEDVSLAPLQLGQMRRCQVDSALLFDLEAHPVA